MTSYFHERALRNITADLEDAAYQLDRLQQRIAHLRSERERIQREYDEARNLSERQTMVND